MTLIEIMAIVARVLIIFGLVMGFVPILIWMERKGAAYIQDRRGPNRAAIMGIRLGGLVHSLADAIKLLSKEEIAVGGAHRPAYVAAPLLAFIVPVMAVAAVPFTGPAKLGELSFSLQVADLGAGLVYVMAVSSLGVYALLLAGWSSCNKFSLLGAIRSSAQMISYELAMGMAALAIFIVAGSLSLDAIVEDQSFWPWRWNAVRQPIAFLIFFAAMLAEANRLPFDLPEGESEIVAGYHTEYSSMRFAMFFMGEYAHIFVGSAVIATLFFGGWQIPFVESGWIIENANLVLAIAWPALSVALIAGGATLAFRFKRRFGDMRDFEVLIIGGAAIAAGVTFMAALPMAAGITLPEWLPDLVTLIAQFIAMLAKTLALCAVFIWIRWTLPRFRYDQLMAFGWKVLFPLGMANAMVTAIAMLWYG